MPPYRRRNISIARAARHRPPYSRNPFRRNPFPRPPPGSLAGPPAPPTRTPADILPVRHPRLPTRPSRPPCTGRTANWGIMLTTALR